MERTEAQKKTDRGRGSSWWKRRGSAVLAGFYFSETASEEMELCPPPLVIGTTQTCLSPYSLELLPFSVLPINSLLPDKHNEAHVPPPHDSVCHCTHHLVSQSPLREPSLSLISEVPGRRLSVIHLVDPRPNSECGG